MDNSKVYRKKSLEKISSPEQLTDYLRVTNPGIWLILAAAVMLLAGLIVWSSVGRLETLTAASVSVTDGTAIITVGDDSEGRIASGMSLRVGAQEFEISKVEKDTSGKTVAYAPVTLANGNYDASIVVESISPISFLIK